MTALPPSPFLSADDCESPVGTAAAQSSSPGAAAEHFDESSTSTGRSQEAQAPALPHEVGAGFWDDLITCLADHRFVLDAAKFMEDIEEMPMFLRAG